MPAAAAEARLSLRLPDETATARLAEDVAAVLKTGDLVALSGGLGAGKTTFARALLRALAGDPALEVPSPTFPLRIDHALSRLKVAHADLYRLRGVGELAEVGLDEALSEGALLVEWPEALPARLSEERLDVALGFEGEGRRAEIVGHGTWPARLARSREIRAFLDRSGCAGALRVPLAGDASYRTYERIGWAAAQARVVPHPRSGGGGPPKAVEGAKDEHGSNVRPLHHAPHGPPPPSRATGEEPRTARREKRREAAILMNSPARALGPRIYNGRTYDEVAHRATDVRAFVAIDSALRERGVRAPEILAADIDVGLLLLEDLGNEPIVDTAGAPIMERYEAAIDLLVFMHGLDWPAEAPLPDGSAYRLPPYDREALLVEISLFPDWSGHGGEPPFPKERRDAFLAAWSKMLDHVGASSTTWVMRDFHSPNILWQSGAAGIGRVGVIDFQDALIGHPAYDVASLAQDARVPLTEAQESRLKARYVAGRRAQHPSFDAVPFDMAYAAMGLQRATKLLGIFTRLALAEGKPGYLRYRERVKEVVRRNLAHPFLSDMRLWYEPYL